MPSSDEQSIWNNFSKNLPKTVNTPGDYAAFFAGSAAGVVVDFLFAGVSLGQGTVGGGLAGLAFKKTIDALMEKRLLRRQIGELKRYYKQQKDAGRADKLGKLIDKARIIKTMTADEIRAAIIEIEA